MLADHSERAAKDGAVTPSDVDAALNAMDKQVHDLMAKVAKL